jgi:hypothetical protein
VRRPLQPEPSRIGPQRGLPDNAVPSVPQSVDTATLDLLSIWQQEDTRTDPAQLKAAEEELAVFMKAVNEARTASGESLVYP